MALWSGSTRARHKVLDFKPISLGLRSNPMRSGRNGAARLINCFAEMNGEEHISPWSIYPSLGLSNFGAAMDIGDSDFGIRGMLAVGNTLYVVAGRNLYSVDTFGNSNLIGGIPTDGPVYMERNRRSPTQIGIVTDGNFYIVDSNILTQIEDADLPAPNSLSFMDGYFVFSILDGRWFISAIDDGTDIDALDFAKAESNPDNLLRIIAHERELLLLGAESTEWWQNTGATDFPFTRSQAINIGCLAGGTAARVATDTANTVLFVANDHTVRRVEGYTLRSVSNNEIEQAIRDYHEAGSDLAQMTATSWEDAGRFFYCLSTPSWSRCYDSKTGHWHERESYNSARWRVGQVVKFGTKLIAGDATTGQLYLMSDAYFSEGSNPLISKVVAPPVHMTPYRFICDGLRVNIETGVGLNTTATQNLDPYMMVRLSRDAGNSWHSSFTLPLGKLAQTQVSPKAYRLGQFDRQGMTVEFSISAEVFRRWDGAFAATRQLAA